MNADLKNIILKGQNLTWIDVHHSKLLYNHINITH